MQVLEQGIPEHVLVGSALDHRGNGGEAEVLGRAETALAHDQLVLRPAGNSADERPDDDGLEHADLADRDDELVQLLLAELGARLLRVRHDVVGREVRQTGARHGKQTLGRLGAGREEHVNGSLRGVVAGGDEGADAAAEARSLGGGHYFGAPRWAISDAASRYESEPGELPS